jgi:hypothetical protein
MSATAAMQIGSDLRNARIHSGLSVASELATWLDKPKNSRVSLFDAWKMNRILNRLNRSSEGIVAELERVIESHAISPLPPDRAGAEYGSVRDLILDEQAVCAHALDLQAGFSGYGFLRKKMARLQINSERLLDLADWLDAMSTPEEMEARFKALAEDIAEGNYVPLALVQ